MTERERLEAAFAAALAEHPNVAPGPSVLNAAMGLRGGNKINGRMTRRRTELLEEAGFVKVFNERREGRWVRPHRTNGASDE